MASLAPQILEALAAASSPSAEVRHHGESQLQQLRANADLYFSSCADILVNPAADLRGRQLVGFQLKNNLMLPACASNTRLQSAVCEQAIVDPQRIIRNVAGSVISVAVREGLWPVQPVVQRLGQVLTQRSGELGPVHGAIRTLSYIVDDAAGLLDEACLTAPVLQAALPFLTSTAFGVSDRDALEVRLKAFEVISLVLEIASLDFESNTYKSLKGCILPVIDACFTNLQAPLSQAMATSSIKCLVLCLTFYEEISNDLFSKMMQLMFQATTSNQGAALASTEEENLRIEATSFWRALIHFPNFAELAQPTVQQVVPALIRAMVYSDMEIGMLQTSAEDWQEPDKADAIRPRHYQARGQAMKDGPPSKEGDGGANDDEDDDDDDEEVEEWNLRRVSALTLDEISEYYGEAILMPVLTCIDGMMQPSQPWKELEAAVLALGAICEGCFDSLEAFLPDISARLLQLLQSPDTHFLVVCIALWACTRMAPYIIRTPDRLQLTMTCTLQKMQNPSKMVQEGAVEALMELLSHADDDQLHGFTPAIVQTVAECLGGYQLKNRVLLFEALEVICGKLGDALRGSEALISSLMTPLGNLWASTPSTSPLLWGLFDCMSSVCSALGPSIQPMALDIFNRSYGMLQDHMQQRIAARQSGEEPVEEEFLVTSGNLLSGLFDAIGSGLEPLIAQHEPAFMQVVLAMLIDESPDIRQNGFCLASDVARSCPAHVQRVLAQYCDAAVRNVSEANEASFAVVSNVAWSLCSLLEHQIDGTDLPTLQSTAALPHLFSLLGNFLGRLNVTADMRNMVENVSLCLGVMLYVDAEVERKANCSVAVFASPFCRSVRNIRESSSLLEVATNGFLGAVQQNPHLVLNNLPLFVDLACSVAAEGVEARRIMQLLLANAAQMNSTTWQQMLAGCTEQSRKRLYEIYGLQ